MNIESTKAKALQSSEMPFIRERMVCRTNALIEVLKLPFEKLKEAGSVLIATKLLEISDNKTLWLSSSAQNMQLNLTIFRMCEDESAVEKVMMRAEQKFDYFIKTQKLV